MWWLFLPLSLLFLLHCIALNVVYIISMFYNLFMICGPHVVIFYLIPWTNNRKIYFVFSECRVGSILIRYTSVHLTSILLYQLNYLHPFSGCFTNVIQSDFFHVITSREVKLHTTIVFLSFSRFLVFWPYEY